MRCPEVNVSGRESDPVTPPSWRRYLRFWSTDLPADVRDEVDFHLAGLVEELRAEGMSEDDARRAALVRFGDVARTTATMQALAARQQAGDRRAAWMRGLRQDVMSGIRALRHSPLVSATIVGTLAVGLGAAAAVFSLVDQLYWRPPAGVVEPSRLRRVWIREWDRFAGARPIRPAISYPRHAVLDSTFGERAAFGLYMADTNVRFGSGPRSPKVHLTLADRDYFRVLGAGLAQGRLWDESEDLVKEPSPVAVVSSRFAAEHLRDSAQAIGSRIELAGRMFTVVGVAAEGFGGVELQPADVWVPLGDYAARQTMPGLANWWERRVFPSMRAVVRLAPGVDEAALAALGTARLREHERAAAGAAADTLISMELGSIIGVRGPGERPREVAIAARLGVLVVVMLVIACANVANLLLARATERRRELTVRVAIGASRWRLLRLLIIESLILAVPAGIATAVGAVWAGSFLRAALLPGIDWSGPVLHWRVALFALAATFGASWMTGIIPAMVAARTDPGEALKSGGRTATAGRSRLRFALTSTQLALSVALLVAAGAFVNSLERIRALDLGLDPERIVTAAPDFDDRTSAPPGEAVAASLEGIATYVRRMPGVEQTALSASAPMSGRWIIMQYYSGTDSLQMSPSSDDWAALFMVSPEYFSATGMRFVRGGPFPIAANGGGVVVNETMARMLWPGRDPLGQCMQLERRTSACVRVTGVVADARRHEVMDEEARPQYFIPPAMPLRYRWMPSTIVARVHPEHHAGVIAALRDTLARTFPAATPNVASLQEALAPQLRPWTLGAQLFTALGTVALMLTLIGVYSNVAYHVSQRTREFAVRVALGARLGDVVRAVTSVGLRPVFVGCAIGIALAFLTGRLIAGVLYKVSPHDPLLVGTVILLLLVVSVAAMLAPAWRASRVDPVVALREE